MVNDRATTFVRLLLDRERDGYTSPELRAFFEGWVGPTLPSVSAYCHVGFEIHHRGVAKLDMTDEGERQRWLSFSRRLEEIAYQIAQTMGEEKP